LSPARVDRYVAMLRDAGIAPILVLSKVDLVDDVVPLIEKIAAAAPGAPVIALSIESGAGIDELRSRIGARRTAVLLGSSGVGKSSLLNVMLGADVQRVRPIREDDRGRHTTTRRELFVAPDGSLWIDTPGMRELARWAGEEDEDEDDAFEDVVELAAACRFRDCHHRAEPGCAVRGKIDPARLASFLKLAEERDVGVTDQHAARRIAETRKAKAKRYVPRPDKPDE
jgi:ribosome biogenesis GTPase